LTTPRERGPTTSAGPQVLDGPHDHSRRTVKYGVERSLRQDVFPPTVPRPTQRLLGRCRANHAAPTTNKTRQARSQGVSTRRKRQPTIVSAHLKQKVVSRTSNYFRDGLAVDDPVPAEGRYWRDLQDAHRSMARNMFELKKKVVCRQEHSRSKADPNWGGGGGSAASTRTVPRGLPEQHLGQAARHPEDIDNPAAEAHALERRRRGTPGRAD